ncbi:MAG: nicotinate (nicotinamide) nucleotide adenylyltransferase [SAR324 cluster bacterium]|nr:nicotinate (nicotinamide) nucleotide adenylyltransferase [SAR324 cluster bacterium]
MNSFSHTFPPVKSEKISVSRRYALFGGSFNPIHQGHVEIVRYLLENWVEYVYVMPAGCSPFKDKSLLLPDALRLKMTQAAFDGWTQVTVSSLEIQQPGASYTWNTLQELCQHTPNDSWYLILGMDAFLSFYKWYRARQIMDMASLLVFPRTGFALKPTDIEQTETMNYFRSHWPEGEWNPEDKTFKTNQHCLVQFLDTVVPDISATDIREQTLIDSVPESARCLYQQYLAERSF